MSDICCICFKPINDTALVARYEGWEKHWHPTCFAQTASAEISALEARLKTERTATIEAQKVARRAFRCAQHLAIMHRRENRVMEGAEGELEEIRRTAGPWLTEDRACDEDEEDE